MTAATRTLWAYWENLPGRDKPGHIALCHQIMRRKAAEHGYRFELVTPDSVRRWLPELSPRLQRIALAPEGWRDRLFGRARRQRAAIAQRADYIRALLLHTHGGLYIDSDAIVLESIQPYFDALDAHGFLVTRRSSLGKRHTAINFYGARPGNPVIAEYVRQMGVRLTGPLDYRWNEVGHEMLTPIVDAMPQHALDVPESEIQPITWEQADAAFPDTTLAPEAVLRPDTRIFMLYSGPFKGVLKDVPLEQLYWSDMLISRIYRRALGIASREDFRRFIEAPDFRS